MRYLQMRCTAAVLAVLLLAGRGAASDDNEEDIPPSPTVKALQRVKPSVVAVKVPGSGRTKDLTGTGLIVDERGYIITNRHVIASASRVTIRLLDESEHVAQVILADAETDLAVLRIKTDRKLIAQPLASSTGLLEGQDVIAVGHPYGYSYTATRGIVSALGRRIPMPNGYVLTNLIQTDAAINPGNSGGPLLNVRGAVIGINVALREDAQNIAFAIPSDTARRVLATHLSALKVAGVSHGLSCRELLVEGKGPRRVVVASVDPNVIAAGAGLQKGDVITRVGRLTVVNRFDVERALWDARPGQRVSVTILRAGREVQVSLPLSGSGSEATTARR
ncbi:MAG: trypsin-like peptidase domain-containing protein [Gemmataceae bacterium]|nr:trypsin-like peptidase domain-containing protein [Gemmataceae bacterium]